MGFLGGIGDALFGEDTPSTSRSGFALLPQEIQDAFTGFASRGTSLLGGGAGDAMFTPMGMTQDEANAFDMFRRGLAPQSAADISRDVGLFMNPFDDYVLQDINDQAQGNYSLLKQAVTDAGQFGSNRHMLGASEIERQRLDSIGTFKQNQYNNALNMAMNQLAGLRQQDATNLAGIGAFERGLDTQTRQAPVNALNAWANLIRALPQDGGSEATGAFDDKGLFDVGAKVGQIAMGFM